MMQGLFRGLTLVFWLVSLPAVAVEYRWTQVTKAARFSERDGAGAEVERWVDERLAPKAAAFAIPSVKGEPRGFLRIDCMDTPETARPAPAATAARAWGRRMLKMMISH